MHIEAFLQLLFQRNEFLSQLPLVPEQRAHFEKRSHDENAHLHRTRTIKDIGGHNGSVFSEGVRLTATPSVTWT